MMEDKLQSESQGMEGNSSKNQQPLKRKTPHSSKQNLDVIVLDENTDTENGSSKRQNIQKLASSRSRCEADHVPPHDVAFSTDKVLEEILSSLDQNSLLQCRLVSHRWMHVSRTVMKKKNIRISFTYNGHHRFHVISSAIAGSPKFPEAVQKSKLQDLTQFLKKSYPTAGSVPMDAFPCNAIEIRGGSVLNANARSFLEIYGKYIRHLYLDYTADAHNIPCYELMDKLEDVLFVQVPNLETFSFFMDCTTNVRHRYHRASKCTDTQVSNSSRVKNAMLHTLTIGALDSGPRCIFETIIFSFSNLKQINVDFADILFLLEPVNQLYFLRQLHIYAPFNPVRTLRTLEKFEAAICSLPPEIPAMKLTILSVNGSDMCLSPKTKMRPCLVRVINKLLEGSWDTLKSITFTNYNADAFNGINWPPALPKVEDLTLCPRDSCGLKIFPLDGNFKISEKFPRLQQVNFDVAVENIQKSSPEKFSRKCNLGPVLTVKRVKVNVLLEPNPDDPFHIIGAEENLRERQHYSDSLLSKLFPRADFSLNFQHRQM